MYKHDDKLFNRYLQLLGINARKPELDFLNELVNAQMQTIPFENISKLYYFHKSGQVSLVSLEQYLDGIEHFHFGGTCYANNYYLHCLLKYLGFDAHLCGADMNNPDVHIVNMVTFNGHEYLVDVGYAAPFMRAMPLDLADDQIFRIGTGYYVLKPRNESGRSRIEYYHGDELIHGYLVNPEPRKIEEFQKVIAGSLSAKATFRNSILIVRFFENGLIRLHNRTFQQIENSHESSSEILDAAQLPQAIESHFQIPANITTEALHALLGFESPWN
jgi:N-hydroxyarylamine O-acetyltransferase